MLWLQLFALLAIACHYFPFQDYNNALKVCCSSQTENVDHKVTTRYEMLTDGTANVDEIMVITNDVISFQWRSLYVVIHYLLFLLFPWCSHEFISSSMDVTHINHSNRSFLNPLYPELNPICYLLALLAYHFLHVSMIRVKSLTIRLLMSYIYIYIYIYDISNLRVKLVFHFVSFFWSYNFLFFLVIFFIFIIFYVEYY